MNKTSLILFTVSMVSEPLNKNFADKMMYNFGIPESKMVFCESLALSYGMEILLNATKENTIYNAARKALLDVKDNANPCEIWAKQPSYMRSQFYNDWIVTNHFCFTEHTHALAKMQEKCTKLESLITTLENKICTLEENTVKQTKKAAAEKNNLTNILQMLQKELNENKKEIDKKNKMINNLDQKYLLMNILVDQILNKKPEEQEEKTYTDDINKDFSDIESVDTHIAEISENDDSITDFKDTQKAKQMQLTETEQNLIIRLLQIDVPLEDALKIAHDCLA